MESLLVLSAIGEDKVGIVEQITSLALECECSIVDQRVAVLGGQCATIMMVKGEWNALVKLEYEAPALAQKLSLTTIAQKTSMPDTQPMLLPYAVRLTTLDVPGIANKVSAFFASKNINIEEVYAHSYAAPITGSALVKIKMQISLSPEVNISHLKDDFNTFCADYNLDATLHPIDY